MAKRYDLILETDRFNLSQPKATFINACCYGDDVATWLRARLAELGIETTEPVQEDWGWTIEVLLQGNVYFLGIGGNAFDESSGNRGEWRFILQKHRSLTEKLTGRNQMDENDVLIGILEGIVESEPDMKLLRIE